MRRSTPYLLFALGLALTPTASAQVYDATVDCAATPTGHVDWPADDPVWSFDFVRPARSAGPNGSGLELRDVHYRGRLVFRQAHVPILNVEYDSACGCFRDWSDSESAFTATGVRPPPEGCFADAAPGTVVTHCDAPGPPPDPFRGVAVEDYGDELVLTSQMSAGWYRYRMKWHFFTDGRIWPEFSFSAAPSTCAEHTHRHHTYWRFDFDLLTGQPGDGVDQVWEVNPAAGTRTRFENEITRTWGDPDDGVFWAVRDARARAGYAIRPSAADLALPVDDFSKFDLAVVRYQAGHLDDSGGTGGCAVDTLGLGVDGEPLANQDVVLWYRSGVLHAGGNPGECDIVGPTLIPFRRDRPPLSARDDDEPTLEELLTAEPAAASAEAMPGGYELQRAQPNPFNPSTTVRFRVAEAQRVTLALYDALGRRVATLHEGYAQANRYESVRVDGSSLPSGTYTVVLEGETVRGTTRVVLIK